MLILVQFYQQKYNWRPFKAIILFLTQPEWVLSAKYLLSFLRVH